MTTEKEKLWAGVILAGGESSRFGEPKAFVRYNGKYFYEYSLQALVPFTNQVVIISHPSLTSRFSQDPAVKVTEDIPPFCGKGPMAGLYSAMKQVTAEWYVVLPCDMPLINEKVMNALIAEADRSFDAVIPSIAGRQQPLAAVYHRRVLPVITAQLTKGNYRMIDLLSEINVKKITEADLQSTERLFQNINTKDAYRQLFVDE